MGVCNLAAVLFWDPVLASDERVAYGLLCLCIARFLFVGKECLLLCGVSDDRCTGFSCLRWLFGGCMVGLLVVLLVPLLLSFLAKPGPSRILRVSIPAPFTLYVNVNVIVF